MTDIDWDKRMPIEPAPVERLQPAPDPALKAAAATAGYGLCRALSWWRSSSAFFAVNANHDNMEQNQLPGAAPPMTTGSNSRRRGRAPASRPQYRQRAARTAGNRPRV